jgi:hypothetical protein
MALVHDDGRVSHQLWLLAHLFSQLPLTAGGRTPSASSNPAPRETTKRQSSALDALRPGPQRPVPGARLRRRGVSKLAPRGVGKTPEGRGGRRSSSARVDRRRDVVGSGCCPPWRDFGPAPVRHRVAQNARSAKTGWLNDASSAWQRRAGCPQRDSNPRYSLERAVTWTASRWGRAFSGRIAR